MASFGGGGCEVLAEGLEGYVVVCKCCVKIWVHFQRWGALIVWGSLLLLTCEGERGEGEDDVHEVIIFETFLDNLCLVGLLDGDASRSTPICLRDEIVVKLKVEHMRCGDRMGDFSLARIRRLRRFGRRGG